MVKLVQQILEDAGAQAIAAAGGDPSTGPSMPAAAAAGAASPTERSAAAAGGMAVTSAAETEAAGAASRTKCSAVAAAAAGGMAVPSAAETEATAAAAAAAVGHGVSPQLAALLEGIPVYAANGVAPPAGESRGAAPMDRQEAGEGGQLPSLRLIRRAVLEVAPIRPINGTISVSNSGKAFF